MLSVHLAQPDGVYVAGVVAVHRTVLSVHLAPPCMLASSLEVRWLSTALCPCALCALCPPCLGFWLVRWWFGGCPKDCFLCALSPPISRLLVYTLKVWWLSIGLCLLALSSPSLACWLHCGVGFIVEVRWLSTALCPVLTLPRLMAITLRLQDCVSMCS
jgi:hypothetical protein